MPDLTDEQLDEHVRRLVQIRHSTPAELTDADLEAMTLAHRDGCVRVAAAELLEARGRASLEHTLRSSVLTLETELIETRARIAELEHELGVLEGLSPEHEDGEANA
ncbi:hypothetical protein [Nocardia otitidiscaviarum]|uniref:hypothetical protein n=1 Tax=Nocardia otitidiscaviarum TaxID=1823 RepID=UPI0004A78210|nr:hypothetical protein [Nocardia otitidiscaviarum]